MMLPVFNIYFRPRHPLTIEEQLDEIHQFLPALKNYSSDLGQWYLKGETVADALLYPLFDHGINPKALAKLQAAPNAPTRARVLGFWNGLTGDPGASLRYLYREANGGCVITLELPPTGELNKEQEAKQLIQTAIEIWQPTAISLRTAAYSDHQTFTDRLPMGWLLYLARPIEAEFITEAAKIIPISVDEKIVGTLLMSNLEKFDDANEQHLKQAKSIEIRLANEDLLPRYSEL
jgi:hypothetical protein